MRKQNRDIKDELTDLGATHLAEWQGRTVDPAPPPAFFPNFAELVMAEVNDKSTPSPLKVVSRRSAPVWWRIAVAALVVLSLGIWWISNPLGWSTQENLAELDWQMVADEDLQAYVWANIDDFDLELLEQVSEPTPAQQLLDAELEISTETLEDFINSEDEWLESDELDLF